MSSPSVRHLAAVPALLVPSLLAGMIVAAAPAAAQVTTSQQALDALGSDRPAPVTHAPPRPPFRHRAVVQPAQRPVARGVRMRAASAHPPAATIPSGPPPPPVFRAPVINVPLHPSPPPPPVPVVPTATGRATPLADGTRISFGIGSADLNPETTQALHGIAARLRASPATRIDLDAFGSASADDPSTPRRLAFERGVAARAVLINDGIASTRIYVRVIGAAPAATDGAPPDRIDLLPSPAVPGAPVGPAPASPGATPGAPPAEPGHPSP